MYLRFFRIFSILHFPQNEHDSVDINVCEQTVVSPLATYWIALQRSVT